MNVTPPPPHTPQVDRVLAPALAHRLLSIPSDFFIYEYLYKNHTRHYHPDADGRLTGGRGGEAEGEGGGCL